MVSWVNNENRVHLFKKMFHPSKLDLEGNGILGGEMDEFNRICLFMWESGDNDNDWTR